MFNCQPVSAPILTWADIAYFINNVLTRYNKRIVAQFKKLPSGAVFRRLAKRYAMNGCKHDMLVKIFSWLQITVGVIALCYVGWLAFDTKGFDRGHDLHGFVMLGAMVFGIIGFLLIFGGILTRRSRFGPYVGGIFFVGSIIWICMIYFGQ